jgi:hypothetical protein
MAENTPERKPWDRMADESDAAYDAFKWYMSLPGPRRLVGDAYYKKLGRPRPPCKDAPGGWRAWSKLYKWADRAEAYDIAVNGLVMPPPEDMPPPDAPPPRHETVIAAAEKIGETRYREITAGEAERRAEIAKVVKQRAGITVTDDELDWVEQRRLTRMDDLDLANRLIKKGREMLDVALIKRRIVPADPENGKPQIDIYEPAKWSFKTMAEMLQIAVQIRRLSAEMPTKIADDKEAGGADDESMFIETVGQMESVIQNGVVPPMPVDATRRPTPPRPGAADAAAVTVPGRMRPG